LFFSGHPAGLARFSTQMPASNGNVPCQAVGARASSESTSAPRARRSQASRPSLRAPLATPAALANLACHETSLAAHARRSHVAAIRPGVGARRRSSRLSPGRMVL
jgi:hypothetical protein